MVVLLLKPRSPLEVRPHLGPNFPLSWVLGIFGDPVVMRVVGAHTLHQPIQCPWWYIQTEVIPILILEGNAAIFVIAGTKFDSPGLDNGGAITHSKSPHTSAPIFHNTPFLLRLVVTL